MYLRNLINRVLAKIEKLLIYLVSLSILRISINLIFLKKKLFKFFSKLIRLEQPDKSRSYKELRVAKSFDKLVNLKQSIKLSILKRDIFFNLFGKVVKLEQFDK